MDPGYSQNVLIWIINVVQLEKLNARHQVQSSIPGLFSNRGKIVALNFEHFRWQPGQTKTRSLQCFVRPQTSKPGGLKMGTCLSV